MEKFYSELCWASGYPACASQLFNLWVWGFLLLQNLIYYYLDCNISSPSSILECNNAGIYAGFELIDWLNLAAKKI